MSEKKASAGAPAWVMTFADLMSLLMCFFVLLLSFAEMDIIKFKQVAGSMKMAFGVQQEAPSAESEQTQEFLEGRESPTPLAQPSKETVESPTESIQVPSGSPVKSESPEMAEIMEALRQAEIAEQEEINRQRVMKLTSSLQDEINKGMVEIDSDTDNIVIRISEQASFPSGTSDLRTGFLPTLQRLQAALADVDGEIIVAGHTDNQPIRTAKFRSNWELSASRAVSVVHELLKAGKLPLERFVVEGHADGKPLVANDSAENRAKNRRVELTIVHPGKDAQPNKVLELPPAAGSS